MQLPEYRQMYKTGRIREDVLQMVIEKKKPNAVAEWKEKFIGKEYDIVNHPPIGLLRKYW